VAWTFPLLEAFRVLENNLSGAHCMHKQASHAQGALHDARAGLVMWGGTSDVMMLLCSSGGHALSA